MSDFFSTLIPWANWWNGGILTVDIIVLVWYLVRYRQTKNRNLLTSMPGLFTSLGILGTFGAICSSLAGISASPEVVSNVGKSVGEAFSSTSGAGALDLKRIISDLIPAFSTSIYGLVFAFFSSFFTKLHFAREDAALADRLKYKDPETALEALDSHILELTRISESNNNTLNDSILAQSQILSKFVDTFVERMESTFEAMNTSIEQRVTTFGTTQYTQSRQILESITKQLGEDATAILNSHNESVKAFTEASSADLSAIKDTISTAVATLKDDTVSGIEELTRKQISSLQKLSEDSLSLHMQSIEDQQKFNEGLLDKMSTSLGETTTQIINGVGEQILVLKQAVADGIKELQEAYGFITDKSASIVSNYEQATEAYRDALQNAHDFNERAEKGLVQVGDGLKAVGQTNENVMKVMDLIQEKESNMEAIVMRIEELGKAIETLQQLESVLSRIASK